MPKLIDLPSGVVCESLVVKEPKHPKRLKDLSGMRFGELEVVGFVGYLGNSTAWLCHCELCCSLTVMRQNSIAHRARHCGCQRKIRGKIAKIDGRMRHWIYNRWQSLASRQLLIEEWQEDFWSFASCVARLPADGKKLTRKNNKRPMGPDNFQWKLARSSSVKLKGEVLLKADAARELGVSLSTLYRILRDEQKKDRFGLTENSSEPQLAGRAEPEAAPQGQREKHERNQREHDH